MNLTTKRYLLILNCTLASLGNVGGPLLLRLYFLKGGNRVWLSSWLETGGWPVLFLPLLISYFHRCKNKGNDEEGGEKVTKVVFITPFLFVSSAILGVLTGLDDYMYARGVSLLPVSTSALIISTQLGFTAGFALLIVKQKFTPYSVNAIALLTIGAVILGVHVNGDRPKNESNKKYYLGFFMTLGAAALYGFVLPMVEFTYKKSKQVITYTLVLEMQLVISFFATIFCSVGMLVNKDFQAIPREAREYKLGEVQYYTVLVMNTVLWQCFFLGSVGVIFCSSSLLCGIIIAGLIPVTEVLAVIIYHEKFTSGKGIALTLSLWGFASYFYGEYRQSKQNKQKEQPIQQE